MDNYNTSTLKNQIDDLREKLNKSITSGYTYDAILCISQELDKLISQYYTSEKE